MTTLRDAQDHVDRWIQSHGGYWDPFQNLARLSEEVGELARAVNQTRGLKALKPGEKASDPAQELGDVLWVTVCLANQLGVDLEKALAQTLAKVGAR
jgi:NTP pyrophosphatase (non-canonical NTP hydrolase)